LKAGCLFFLLFIYAPSAWASYILIPMDAQSQENHLKAYGITYWVLSKNEKVKWLLNYRGGGFLIKDNEQIQNECKIRGVSFELLSDAATEELLQDVSSPSKNQDAV